MIPLENLTAKFDPLTGAVEGVEATRRHLSDLRDAFADPAAVDRIVEHADPVVYTISSVKTGTGEGALQYGVACIMPGQVNGEYYLTKGHIHAWRPAAEVYIGFRGRGKMILQEESSSTATIVDLFPHSAVYVPGSTAHRTVNTGDEPLIYMGVYPALAGHDYTPLAGNNFSKVVVARNGTAVVLDRSAFMASLTSNTPDQE